MKVNLVSKTLILLLVSGIFLNCSNKTDDVPPNLEVNDFVWKGLNAYYLWQSAKPDLSDRRFSSQLQLNNYLSSFSAPEDLFENLLNRPSDRFSWIVDDYIALENSFQGINLSTGMEFGLVPFENNSGNYFGYVRYVVPNSDADLKGITRGMLFNTVDGNNITINNYRSLLFSNDGFTIGLADYNNGNPTSNNSTFTLIKEEVLENPIHVSKVITEGTKKIGYLLYNQFARNYDGQLNAAINNFKTTGIDHLIIDLRYNGGGSVATATYFGSMITGQFNNQLFSKEVWNEKVQAAVNPESFINNFTDEILNKDSNGNVVLQETINSLNFTEVYFIVSGSSASASELLINSLRAYIDVKIVGTTTVGKQVGSVTLYDSDNLTKSGSNFNTNHTYAMQPIVFEISNKDNKNEPNGFTPGVTLPGILLAEDYENLGVLGDKTEPLLNRTIEFITTGKKGASKNRIEIFKEFYNSKLANPSSNTMYTDFK